MGQQADPQGCVGRVRADSPHTAEVGVSVSPKAKSHRVRERAELQPAWLQGKELLGHRTRPSTTAGQASPPGDPHPGPVPWDSGTSPEGNSWITEVPATAPGIVGHQLLEQPSACPCPTATSTGNPLG